jgi:hypothetical protein
VNGFLSGVLFLAGGIMQAISSEFLVIDRKERANCRTTRVLNKQLSACFILRTARVRYE